MIIRLRNLDRRLLTILLIVFVQMVGASMVNPILPIYAKNEFGLEPEVITLLLTAFFAAQFIAGPFIGRLSDTWGRLPVLIISQIGTVIAFAMIGLAQTAELLFFARVLDGITGGNIIVAQAYVTDIMPEEKRTQALGYIFAVFGLGFIVGPAAGGALSALFGPQIPFLIAAVAATITVLITWFNLEETVTEEVRAKNKDKNKAKLNLIDLATNVPLVAALLITFIAQFGFGMLIGVLALYGEAVLFAGYSSGEVSLGVGLMLAVVGLGQFSTQMFLLPRALKRFTDPAIVLIGSLSRVTSMFLLAIAVGPLFGFLAAPFVAMGAGLMMPPLQSLATRTVPGEFRGAILGIYQSVISLAVIISTAMAGVLFSLNPRIPFVTGMILFSLSTLPGMFLWNWSRKNKRKNDALVVVPS